MANTKVSQVLKTLLSVFVQDVPARDQACEACREPKCSSERSATCPYRLLGAGQESMKRGLPMFTDQPYLASQRRFSEWTDEEFKEAAHHCGDTDWIALREQSLLAETYVDEVLHEEQSMGLS